MLKNRFFVPASKLQGLNNIKSTLQSFKETKTVPQNAFSVLKTMTKNVVDIICNTKNSTNKTAGWLLLADVYGQMSFLHAQNASDKIKGRNQSLNKALNALQEAVECVTQANIIVKEDHEGLDKEFIKNCNTFNIAEPEEALKIIREKLMPFLKTSAAQEGDTLHIVQAEPIEGDADENTSTAGISPP